MQYDRITTEYYKVPNNLDVITGSNGEFRLLCYFIQITNGGNEVMHPSLSEITNKCKMSRTTVVNTIRRFVDKGYITYRVGSINHIANEYSLNIDKMLFDIKKGITATELQKQYKQEQYDAMALKRIMRNPDLAHKAEQMLGNQVTDGNGNEIKIGVKNE